MAYTKKTWENLPNTNTPLNATGINDLETRIANGFNIIDFLGIPTSEITAEDDLDDFVNEGTYIFEPETTDMPSNVPPMVYLSPFKLLVLNFPDYSDSESKMQIYIGYRGSAIYVRETQVGPSLQWLSWKKIVLNSDLGDKYYTSEQVVGTWIDGKPLYRKVYETNTYATAFNITTTNIETLVDIKGMLQRSDYTNIWQPIPSRLDNAGMSAEFGVITLGNTTNVNVTFGTNWSSSFKKIIIILEYTKTTD